MLIDLYIYIYNYMILYLIILVLYIWRSLWTMNKTRMIGYDPIFTRSSLKRTVPTCPVVLNHGIMTASVSEIQAPLACTATLVAKPLKPDMSLKNTRTNSRLSRPAVQECKSIKCNFSSAPSHPTSSASFLHPPSMLHPCSIHPGLLIHDFRHRLHPRKGADTVGAALPEPQLRQAEALGRHCPILGASAKIGSKGYCNGWD